MPVDIAGARISFHVHDHGAPAVLIEPVLQRIGGAVARRAVGPEDLLHATVLCRVFGERREPFRPHELGCDVGDRAQGERLLRLLRRLDIHRGSCRLVSDRLRPYLVSAAVEARKNVLALAVGEHRRRDALSLRARRHGDTFQEAPVHGSRGAGQTGRRPCSAARRLCWILRCRTDRGRAQAETDHRHHQYPDSCVRHSRLTPRTQHSRRLLFR